MFPESDSNLEELIPGIRQSDTLSIGAMLVKSGKISPQDVDRILQHQAREGIRFGEAAESLGLATQQDIQAALAGQFQYSFLAAGNESLDKSLIAAYRPFDPKVERLRALRTQIVLRRPQNGQNVLAMISAHSGEGRSHTAANLAIVFSQLGEHTLLVDADLRSPVQHKLFASQNSAGLSDWLVGRAGRDVITPVMGLNNLFLLSAGTVPPNPLELLSRTKLSELLIDLRAEYDMVILDSPPADTYADAQAVAAHAGAAMLLTRKHRTEMREAHRIADSLVAAGCNLLGGLICEF